MRSVTFIFPDNSFYDTIKEYEIEFYHSTGNRTFTYIDFSEGNTNQKMNSHSLTMAYSYGVEMDQCLDSMRKGMNPTNGNFLPPILSNTCDQYINDLEEQFEILTHLEDKMKGLNSICWFSFVAIYLLFSLHEFVNGSKRILWRRTWKKN